ncbi:MAG: hypothetical protein OCD02_03485 [Spirochaetaceae bacterium]
MKCKIRIVFLLIVFVVINGNLIGETGNWKLQKTKKDGIIVKSSVSKEKNSEGEVIQLIEYVITTTVEVDFEDCISVIKDVNNHKLLMQEDESKVLDIVSNTEWVVYYSSDAEWPFPSTDCVLKMEIDENISEGRAIIKLSSISYDYETSQEVRLTRYKTSFEFKELEDGLVEIIVSALISPVVNVPNWLIKMSFPEVPAEIVRQIVSLAKI